MVQALYNEHVNAWITGIHDGSQSDTVIMVKQAAIANVLGVLYNLPESVKKMEEEIEAQKDRKAKFMEAQNQQIGGAALQQYPYAENAKQSKSYEEVLKEVQKQLGKETDNAV